MPPPPFRDPRLHLFWTGLRKSCDHNVQGQAPMPKSNLVALLEGWTREAQPNALRNRFLATVQWYGMRRSAEALALRYAPRGRTHPRRAPPPTDRPPVPPPACVSPPSHTPGTLTHPQAPRHSARGGRRL